MCCSLLQRVFLLSIAKKQGSGSGRTWVLDRGYADFAEPRKESPAKANFRELFFQKLFDKSLKAFRS